MLKSSQLFILHRPRPSLAFDSPALYRKTADTIA
jgi:hypothetical protein